MKTVLYLKGSEHSLNQLKRLYETGELTTLLGYQLLDIRESETPLAAIPTPQEALKTAQAPSPPAYGSRLYHQLKKFVQRLMPQKHLTDLINTNSGPPRKKGKALIWKMGLAMTAILVLVSSLILITSNPPTNLIDTLYKMVLIPKSSAMDIIRLDKLAFVWEVSPKNMRGKAPPLSEAQKAFGAGVLTGRERLLENSEATLPLHLKGLKTERQDYFDLGRWAVLLWTVSQFPEDQMPTAFWEEQQRFLTQMQERLQQESGPEAKQILTHTTIIQSLLDKLSADNNPEIYHALTFKLKDMMELK
ncbi:MAG: hypothetical protein DRR16_06780 [Candidatus Parabeggiatoa sp. nov. 3]|nr:MAG: hypothetical protein DRR00_15990 [Gammaproteobacteria bacterium]RKZ87652.1 MAG: hypothetical protein DRR16_06780 [Gammaproteobacteria bacterium]HEW98847.1 hypothetical protein [Beggiatoa sp.]